MKLLSMRKLIAKSYLKKTSNLYTGKGISQNQEQKIRESAQLISKVFPPTPLLCTYINTCWGANLKDNTDTPVHIVAGKLKIEDHIIFKNTNHISTLISSFGANENQDGIGWDGHIWCDFNGTIGDIAIMPLANMNNKSKLFRVVNQNINKNDFFILNKIDNFHGIEYIPEHVLSNSEITALVRGAFHYLKIS